MRIRHALAAAAAAMLIAAPAMAQDYDDQDGPGYGGYGGYGAYPPGYPADYPDERDYGTAPPPPGAARPMPGYRDNGNWRDRRTDSTTDARAGTQDGDDWDDRDAPPPPPVRSRAGATSDGQRYRDAQSDYRARLDAYNRRYGTGAAGAAPADPRYEARIARWRARADACEAGDRQACDGPE